MLKKDEREKNSKLIEAEESVSYFKEIIKTILLIAVVFIGIRYYIVQPFLIVGSSMEPTFQDGEYILVNEFSYNFTSPKRGDVVVFKHPDKECTKFIESNYINKKFLSGPCRNFIKRIVGLPGETVEIKGGAVIIYNNRHPEGFELDEKYIAGINLFGNQKVSLDKNKKEYYVLGDNRQPNGSSDSREWGPLPRDYITGKAGVIVFPLSEKGVVETPKYE